MATPTFIPVHSDTHQHSGPLGIMLNVRARSTELEALHPKRQGRAYQFTFEPPTYYDRDGVLHAMVWCPSCANKLAKGQKKHSDGSVIQEWQRREGFHKDSNRPNGLNGYCRRCRNEQCAPSMRAYRKRKREEQQAA